jgi:acyl-CoA thioester hydrolase
MPDGTSGGLAKLPFMVWARRMEIDFIRPAVGDQDVSITSFVREFRGPDAYIKCSMLDEVGRDVARCLR